MVNFLAQLTLCSVSYKSAAYLDLNWQLTKYLNPTAQYEWVIVENTPPGDGDALVADNGRFKVMPVVEPPAVREKYRASYQHGAALNALLAATHTRFVVLLDPDLFIIRPNWIDDVIAHMQRYSLTFFGVPYHPRWYRKYHDFPCAQALFVDLDHLPAADMNYLPDLINNPTPPQVKIWVRYQELCDNGEYIRGLAYLFRHSRTALAEEYAQRQMVSTSRDVGFFVFQKYSHNPETRSEIVQPVFRWTQQRLTPAGVSPLQLIPFIEKLWPEGNRYISQRPNYFTSKGFREFGLVDLTTHDWEEFVWQERPFAFHVRGYRQRPAAPTQAAPDIASILNSLTGLDVQMGRTSTVQP